MNRKERRAAVKTGAFPRGNAATTTQARRALNSALFAAALRHYQAGQYREAGRLSHQILATDPDDLATLHLAGLTAVQSGRNEAAIDILTKAIELNGQISDLHNALAEALQRLSRLDEAIVHYRQALALDPIDTAALYNCGNVLLRLKRYGEALGHYDRALEIDPNFVEALHNRGNTLFELKHFERALADYDRALLLRPGFVAALGNRGGALIELQRYEEALASCEMALAISPDHATALANRGNALFELRRFSEAAEAFDRLLTIDPDYVYAPGKALYFKLLQSDWAGYDEPVRSIASGIAAGKRVALPYMLLNIVDSPSLQRSCAEIFNKDRHSAPAGPVWRGARYGHEKIRVAYLSADFRAHPMAYLMVGLFETHDRSRFETIAVSVGPDPKDDFRKRLEKSFDRFIDVRSKSDHDVAALLRALEVDIAVDLMGYTSNGRPGILALRSASVQVNFLGYAGTLGANYIDYILADRFVIPDNAHDFYTEKVVYLPDTYYPADSGRQAGGRTPTRAEAGLPENGFVFCCFNQSSRISPVMFPLWMRLLLQVEGSVLWLVEDAAAGSRNLRREAESHGVAADRLIFAPRAKLDEYLARLRLADLFLDTLPYNAHTTASDALWAEVPVVTCAGASFPARVAGSLLNAIGMTELITFDLEGYETLALALAYDKQRLALVRSKLAVNRQNCALFDTQRYRRHIESAYHIMWERNQRGEQPSSFEVLSIDCE
jgi:protein O-GlcNAc transferase